MGAVPEVVHQGLLVPFQSGEIAVPQRQLELQILVRREVRVVCLDPGIHHRPDDPFPLGGERDPRGVRLDRGHRAGEQRADLEVGPDAIDRAFFIPDSRLSRASSWMTLASRTANTY